MKPHHDVIFEPWSTDKVNVCVNKLIKITKDKGDEAKDIALQDPELKQFSQKYQIFFKQLTNLEFVNEDVNLRIIRRLISLKEGLDTGVLTEKEAKAASADIALKELAQKSGIKL